MTRLKVIMTCSLIILCTPSAILAQHPYRSCWPTDGWIVGAGSTIAISALLANQSVTPLTEQEVSRLSRKNVNAFDRPATFNYSKSISRFSDILVSLNAATAMFFLLDRNLREDWRTLSIMSIETALLVTAVPMFVKGQVQRIRPYVYNPEAPLHTKTSEEAKQSFFSGHATVAFASSVFISTVYGDYFPHSRWKPYIWTGSLLLASTVGFLRFASGKHFPTDILTGAVVGGTIGYLIPLLHRTQKGSVFMTNATTNRTLQLGIRFQF